jgi:hypothetical protein
VISFQIMALKLRILTEATQHQSGLWFCHAVDNGSRIVSICAVEKFASKLQEGSFIMIKDFDAKTVDDAQHLKLLPSSKVTTIFIKFTSFYWFRTSDTIACMLRPMYTIAGYL